jgi:type II secretory pathway pseudopilin PulG
VGRDDGFSLAALLATCFIVLLVMAVAVPSWRYVMRDDREKELLFRGFAIVDAISAYQGKHGGASPPSLDALVKGKFLRKAYKDPMSRDGAWRLLHSGEAFAAPAPPPGAPQQLFSLPSPSPSPSPVPSPLGTLGAPAGTTTGLIVGVASRSTAASLRLFNSRSHYNEWIFAVGQPRVIGTTPELTVAQLFGGGPPQPSPISGSGPGNGSSVLPVSSLPGSPSAALSPSPP